MNRSKWKRWVRVGADTAVALAPVFSALRKGSHPIAWVASGIALVRKVQEFRQAQEANRAHWTSGDWALRLALVEAAINLRIGNPLDSSGNIREVGGVEFALRDGGFEPPRGGDYGAWLEAFWAAADGEITVSGGGYLSVRTGAQGSVLEPSQRTREIAEDCARLFSAGHRVGLLLDGRPGSGKSQAVTYVARRLGGRIVRGSLARLAPDSLVEVAGYLRPNAVILDDVDREDTTKVLSAIDALMAQGVAVLCTSNHKGQICDALLRSGRIDLHFGYEDCPADLFEALTASLSDEQRDYLRGHTVATISRHNEILGALGPERARAYAFANQGPQDRPCKSTKPDAIMATV